MSKKQRSEKSPVCVETSDIVLPGYTNMYNTLFGGKLMEMIDKVAAICASRYCHELVVTASVEAVDFHIPIKAGFYVRLYAKVIFTGTSSMMIKVNVFGLEPLSGKSEHCCTAYVNMVAVDKRGKHVTVPILKQESDDDTKDLAEALEIRKSTLARRKQYENRQK